MAMPQVIPFDYARHFPFPEIRSEQHQAIKFALDAFLNKKKKFVILEMGTGCGKSATAIAIARYLQALYESGGTKLGGSYIITTQKVLQEQYVRDFGGIKGRLKQIKSASGYCCQLFEGAENEVSCADIQRLLKSEASCGIVYKICKEEDDGSSSCKFKIAKSAFTQGVEGITNYAYFLASSTYAKDIVPRGLLILDEAHNVENAVGSFVKISFSNFFYKTILGIKTPPINAGQKVVYDWLTQVCLPKLRDVIRKEKRKIERTEDSLEAIESAKRMEVLKRNQSKIEHFIQTYDPDVWVLDSSKTDKRGERMYEFKPIVVGQYCQSMLFSTCERVLILSATILDKDVYCESVGIDRNDVEFLQVPSPFDPKKRPIHYLPVGSMSKNAIEQTLPAMVQIIKMLLDQHPNDKGIIHCVNYRIADHVLRELGQSRLLTHNSENREEVIKFHMSSPHPTVLLSPSMMEGVDLADDASRFQILCKIPFPYLGDAAVQKRMKANPTWYTYQTCKAVVQAMGRSVRNEDDHATSYILDADWERFYRNAKNMFPHEFSAAIIQS